MEEATDGKTTWHIYFKLKYNIMDAEQFIHQIGEVTDPNVKFIKSGNTIVKPLVQLLTEYASLVNTQAGVPDAAKSKKAATKSKKK